MRCFIEDLDPAYTQAPFSFFLYSALISLFGSQEPENLLDSGDGYVLSRVCLPGRKSNPCFTLVRRSEENLESSAPTRISTGEGYFIVHSS